MWILSTATVWSRLCSSFIGSIVLDTSPPLPVSTRMGCLLKTGKGKGHERRGMARSSHKALFTSERSWGPWAEVGVQIDVVGMAFVIN